jgi:hypothetical protein
MPVYPQLQTGALSQFPLMKRRQMRTVLNEAADGTQVKLADSAGAVKEWQLAYTNLSDSEAAALQAFFAATEGSLNGFTFLDPAGNLLAWSENLTNPVWSAAPLLTLAAGVSDPAGGENGWHVTNSGTGPQDFTQTLNAPAGYLYCFSIYVRSAQPVTVTMLAGAVGKQAAATSNWTRIGITASGDPAAGSIAFGLELPAGCAIDVYGPQVEPQASASIYRTSTTGGVYEGARFRDDSLTLTTTDAGRHSTTLNIFYADHL